MSRDDEDEYDDRPRRPRRRDDDEDDRPRRRDDDDRPRRRRDDDAYDDRPRSRRRDDDAGGSNGLAVVGLVLGLLSLCFGALAGIPAVIVSVIARGRPGPKGLATAGLVLGCLGSFLTIVYIALLLPAVQKVREAAARMVEQNNQKQITLGVHTHQSANGLLPPADGPVSWRVHLLPFIQEQALYQRFDVRQPWDSPPNRPASDTFVKPYWSPLDPPGSTDTRYRVFTGPGTLYEPGRPPLPLNRILDGTANTIFCVDAAEAVPWAQPRELAVTPGGPLPALGHPNRDVVVVGMADGSVRAVRKDRLSPDLLRSLITPSGGENVPPDWDGR